MPVRVTPDARTAIRYFNRQQVGLGRRFADAVLDRIADMPLGYGEVGLGVRAAGVRRFGYVVYYRTDGSRAEVLAVLHRARSPDAWQDRV
ncbi:MAG: type II toxin-antitoxin system RelE/ParE family toxin [Fimbriiglobus sp.]